MTAPSWMPAIYRTSSEPWVPGNTKPWSWGNWGKGFVDANGKLVHWKINAPDMEDVLSLGKPHHEDVAKEIALREDFPIQTFDEVYHSPITIAPNGQYTASNELNGSLGVDGEEGRFEKEVTPLRYIPDVAQWESQNRGGGGFAHAPKLAYEWVRNSDGQMRWGPDGAAGMLFHHPATNTYLLAHRSPEVHQGDTWGVPGGAIDKSESPYQAALRETQEELGQVPQHTVTGIHEAAPVPDWKYHTVMANVANQFEPDYANSWETQDHGWFTPQEISQLPLHPGFAAAWNGGHLGSITSGMTRNQYLNQAEEHESFYGPDTSAVLHQFPDGWSIRSPQSPSDHAREGSLMGSCVGMNQTGIEAPGVYESLRDPDNLPHATWANAGPLTAALGRHNAPVKPEYHPYLEEWGTAIGDPDEEYQKWLQHLREAGRISRTSKHGWFYHLAPTQYRRLIEQQGLVPSEEAPESPWAEKREKWLKQIPQPSGVYMYDHPENAKDYAFGLHSRYEDEDDWREDDWDYSGQPDYDTDPEGHEAFEPKYNPQPLYDVWKVNTLGYNPQIDPEEGLLHGALTPEEAQKEINVDVHNNDGLPPDKTAGHRWYVPHAIEPRRLTLHDHVYPSDLTEENQTNRLEEPVGPQIPRPWAQVPLDQWSQKARERHQGDPNVMREIDPQDRNSS